MSFCTVINCMDGRVQVPVNDFCQERFGSEFVDTITEPGPVRLLAERADQRALDSVVDRLAISLEKHGSVGVAIVAHEDCAGNPATESVQLTQLREAVSWLQSSYPGVEFVGLWVDSGWIVHEM
jgi:hypothetical protein